MPAEPVLLSDVARRLGLSDPGAVVRLTDVHHDSRAVTPGTLFVAIPGHHHDGHDFVTAAVAAGASGLVAERIVAAPVPQLTVTDSRAALATAAATVHRDPSTELAVVGVTGTDGKTTVAHMVHAIVSATGTSAGLVGTLGAVIGGERVGLERTTPEASDLQRLLRHMVDAGASACVMEVSSHSLVLNRADEISFAVAAFTNLSQDHLDFHGDMETYFEAKARLFDTGRAGAAVISVDSDWGRRLAGETTVPTMTVGRSETAMIRALDIEGDFSGSRFRVSTPDGEFPVAMPLAGGFNVDNALVAIGVCDRLGISLGDIASGLSGLEPVRGRFETVRGPWPADVLVDYAHTPRAIESAIAEARSLTGGRVIVVVGAGGDRDRSKRPLMGRAAAEADFTVITSDNPRSEDPAAIVDEVSAGLRGPGLVTEVDRTKAIQIALARAGAGDTVLILGKGHETEQEFEDGRVMPFDDREAARSAWSALTGAGAGS